jgi:hypothetical protein
MTPSPFTQRLFSLQVSGRPEDAEELAFLEEWREWKANGGPERFEADRKAELARQYRKNWELRREVLQATQTTKNKTTS